MGPERDQTHPFPRNLSVMILALLTTLTPPLGDSPERLDATELLMKSPSDSAVAMEPEQAPPAIPKKQFSSSHLTTPIHVVPEIVPCDDYDINWPAPPPLDGLE